MSKQVIEADIVKKVWARVTEDITNVVTSRLRNTIVEVSGPHSASETDNVTYTVTIKASGLMEEENSK